MQLVPLVVRLLDELVDAALEVLGDGNLAVEVDALVVGLDLREGELLENEGADRAKADGLELELLALHLDERDVSNGQARVSLDSWKRTEADGSLGNSLSLGQARCDAAAGLDDVVGTTRD